MKLEKDDKLLKILSIVLLVFWMLLIFYFSNQPSVSSNNSSSFIVDYIDYFFNIFNINISLSNYNFINFVIRKLAHVFLFFVLFLLSYNMFKKFNLKNKIIYSLIFSVFYAVTDEFHQLFVVGRSCELKDIFIDSLGIFIGYLLIKVLNRRK